LKSIIGVVLLAVASTAIGCSASQIETAVSEPRVSEVSTPPLGDNETSDLETKPSDDLIGSWKHISSAKTKEGKRDLLKEADIYWTFAGEGTGTYKQSVKGMSGAGGTSKFKWKVEGNTIQLTPDKGGKSTTYTIIDRSGNAMSWRNELLGDYYFVQKQ
jgi:hypothetical protein